MKKGHLVDLSCIDCLRVVPLALNHLRVAKTWELLCKCYRSHLALFVIVLLPSHYLLMCFSRVLLVIEVIIDRVLDQFAIAVYSVSNVKQLVYWVDNWSHLSQLRGAHRWTYWALHGFACLGLCSVKQLTIPLLVLLHDFIVKLLRELDFADVFIEHIDCFAYLFSNGLI